MRLFFFAITLDDHSLSRAFDYVFSHEGFRWLLYAMLGLASVMTRLRRPWSRRTTRWWWPGWRWHFSCCG